MKDSGCLITALAMIMESEGLKIDLIDKKGQKIKVEPNPLNVLRKIYTSSNAIKYVNFDVKIHGACKLLGLGVVDIEDEKLTLESVSNALKEGNHLILRGPSNMFSAKLGDTYIKKHFALITSINDK